MKTLREKKLFTRAPAGGFSAVCHLLKVLLGEQKLMAIQKEMNFANFSSKILIPSAVV
jgi:hypothetical protein